MRTRAEFIVACTIAIAVIILACCGCGREKKVGTDKSPSDLADRLEQLRSLPYAVVTEDTVPSHESGLVLHKPEKAWKGYNIYCIQMVPRAFIIDMEGTVVHEWSYPETEGRWHHIIMLPDGDAVIINMFRHVLRLDWESNLLWRSKFCAHHDIVPLPDGTLYALGQQLQMHRDLFVRFPTIEHLAGDGTVISTWTTHDKLDEIKQHFDTRCFLDTVLDSLLAHESWLTVHEKIAERDEMVRSRGIRPEYDHFHMNTIGILPRTELGEADRRFREGNLLICFRNVNQIGILDRDTMEILWVWGEGILEWPHHPTMLENGNILVFDNGVRRKYSRVIELDPVSATIEWQYVADPPHSFYTHKNGSAQRLPNGNTLICEGDKGRAFEVTKEGEIVWEWLNPLMNEKRRALLYRITRLPPEAVKPLLARSTQHPG